MNEWINLGVGLFSGWCLASWVQALRYRPVIADAGARERLLLSDTKAAQVNERNAQEAAVAISEERWRAWQAFGLMESLCHRMRARLPDPAKLELLASWLDAKYPGDDNPQVQDDIREWAAEIRIFHEQVMDAVRNPSTMSAEAWEAHVATRETRK